MEKSELLTGNLPEKKDKKKNIRFIVNPISGTNKKKNIKSIIEQTIDLSLYNMDICITEYPKHATFLCEDAVKLQYDVVVAVGGDGTINEVGKGLVGSDTLLGIIPMGSGNGLATHLKIPKNVVGALSLINQNNFISIDTFKINDKISLGMAGIGFDAHVAWKFSNSKARGRWSYVSLILKDYPQYKPKSFELIVDGHKVIKEALLLSFANASQYGNNIKIATSAKLDDGFIEIAILKNPPFYIIPLVFMMLKKGNISKSKYYEIIRCKQVEVHEKNIVAHIDGEPNFFTKGMKIEVFPKSLNVIVP